jgi:cellobiose phosphorylase
MTYQIRVTRKGSGNAVSLAVDGKPIEGNIIPLPPGNPSEIQVEVILE